MTKEIYYKRGKREIVNKEAWKECKEFSYQIGFGISMFILFFWIISFVLSYNLESYSILISFASISSIIPLIILIIGYFVNSKRKYEKWGEKRF